MQDILRRGGYFATKVGAICAHFVDMGSLVKTQVGNGIIDLFDLRGQTIDVSDQAIIISKDSGIHDEEGNKTNVSKPITVGQRRSGSFLFFMMMVHPDQADPNCNFSCMTCRARI